MRAIVVSGFVFMVAAQWYAPLSLIFTHNTTIEQGDEFRFRTQPVDPSDPFRGKYVTLNFEAEQVYVRDTMANMQAGDELYAVLSTDSAGFATVDRLSVVEPGAGTPYMSVRVRYPDTPGRVWVEFPFDRFYLEESKASEAEQLYWQSNRNDSTVCYALVRVHDGNATLVDVMINDRSIVDIVREMNKD